MVADINISWTQLRAHEECRQKSFLLRSGKRSPAKDIRGYYGGMVVDRAMRNWLADPARRPGQMAAAISGLIETGQTEAITDGDGVVRWKGPNDRADLHTFCTDLVTRLEPILATRVLPYRFDHGLRFKVPVVVAYLDGTPATINLIGEMDILVHETPATFAVWDLKGTKDNSYWRKVLGQLIFYDLAVLGLHGTATTRVGLIQPMCTAPVLEFAVNTEARRQMWAAIERMASDIWANEISCKTGTAGCTWCEVHHACARYTPQATTLAFTATPPEHRP